MWEHKTLYYPDKLKAGPTDHLMNRRTDRPKDRQTDRDGLTETHRQTSLLLRRGHIQLLKVKRSCTSIYCNMVNIGDDSSLALSKQAPGLYMSAVQSL